MTEGSVEAGRLHLDAYVDTRGVTRGLQQRINAQVKDVRAKIKAEIDTRGSVGQARAAAAKMTRDAASSARVKIKAEIDARSLTGAVKKAATEASRNAVIKFRAELDQGSVAAMTAELATLTARRDVTINVDADTAAAQRRITDLGNTRIADPTAPVRNGLLSTQRQAAAAFSAIGRIPLLTGGFYLLGGALVNVGGGLFAMAASATQAAATLAVIPNLIGTLGQGIVAVVSGFSGIGDAIAAVGEAEGAAATDAGVAAGAREAAARRVQAAQQGLSDALQNAANSAREANEAVSDAQWALARSGEAVRDAREALENAQYAAGNGPEDRADRLRAAEEAVTQTQENATEAQDRLNKARVAARERIEDLNRELRLSAADEAAATFAVIKAQQDLEDARMDASSTEQERAAAEVALLQAQAALERQQAYQEDLAATTAQANADGVKGNEQVKDAVEAVSDTVQSEKDARDALADVVEQNARDARDDARSVRNAEEDLRDSIHAQQEAREALTDSLRNQTQAAAANTRAIANARQELADALRAQSQGMGQVSAAAQKASDAMDNLTPAGRRFVRFIVNQVKPVLTDIRKSIQEAFLPGVQAGVKGSLPLLRAMKGPLTDTARRVGDFVAETGKMLGSKAWRTDVTGIMGENNKALTQFMRAGRNMLNIFKDIAVVAGPTLLRPFSKWTNEITRNWREATRTNRANGDLAEALRNAADRAKTIGRVFRNITTALWGLGEAALGSGDGLWTSLEGATKGWSDWANDPNNTETIRLFFEGAAAILKEVGSALAGVVNLFTKLSDAGQGPVLFVLKAINGVLDGLNAIADIPFVAELLGWLAAAGLVVGALTTMGGAVMKFVTQVKAIGGAVKTGIGVIRNLANGTYYYAMRAKLAVFWTKAQTVATRIQAAAVKAWGVAVKVAAAIARGFRLVAATMFGPWGLAIAAVIGIVVILYKRFAWFRKGVQAVVKGITAAFNWVVDAAKWLWDVLFGHSIFPDIVDGMKWVASMIGKAIDVVIAVFHVLADAAKWLWRNALEPAFKGMSVVVGVLGKVISKVVGAAVVVFDALATAAMWLWQNAIVPAFRGIVAAVRVWWGAVKRVFGFFKAAIRVVASVVRWLWTKAFRPAFRALGAIVRVWWSVMKGYFNLFRRAIRAVGAVVRWLWTNVVKPVFGFIRSAFGTLWNRVIKPTINFIIRAFQGWARIVKWVWEKVVKPTFKFLQEGIKYLWDKVFKPTLSALSGAVERVGGWFKWLWEKAIKPAFNSIKSKIETVWGFIEGVFESVKTWASETLPGAFTAMKDGIIAAFRTMANLALTPVRFVVDTIYNNGIRKMIGFLPGVDEPDPVDTSGWRFEAKTGGILPGFTPGRDVHRFTSRSGGTLDLSGGEAIMRPEWTRLLGADRVNAMNAAARRGATALRDTVGSMFGRGMAYAGGGIANIPRDNDGTRGTRPPSGGANDWAGVRSGTGDNPLAGVTIEGKANAEESSWRKAIGAIKDIVFGFPGWLRDLGTSDWGQMMVDSAKGLADGVRQWINDKIPNSISIPGPNIPLPDNPIPRFYDRGGDWPTGTLGANMSGYTETVFTNRDMVDLGTALRKTAAHLRASLGGVSPVAGTGDGPLVGTLEINALPQDVPGALASANHELRKIRRGGVHARRDAS